jgi:glycerophosphoryl diester phosphodiesterase
VVARAGAARSPFLLLVELKTSQDADSGDALLLADEALAVMEPALDRAIFVGFDWRGLKRIKEQAPEARCWFTTDKLNGDVEPILEGIAASRAEGWFAHHHNATQENVTHARKLGLQVGAWTVNEPGEMKKLIALGLDAICTDRPDLLQSLK